jgi:Adenosine deaminase
MLGKKTGTRKRRFFCNIKRRTGKRLSALLACHPLDPNARPPKLIERLRAEVERAPDGRLTDKELAALSIDPSTARRQFKRHYGMTFQAYHRARGWVLL